MVSNLSLFFLQIQIAGQNKAKRSGAAKLTWKPKVSGWEDMMDVGKVVFWGGCFLRENKN